MANHDYYQLLGIHKVYGPTECVITVCVFVPSCMHMCVFLCYCFPFVFESSHLHCAH